MFEVHAILNIGVSWSQAELIQNCGKTSIKLEEQCYSSKKFKKKLSKSYKNQSLKKWAS